MRILASKLIKKPLVVPGRSNKVQLFKLLRVILWVGIAIVFLRGIMTFVNEDEQIITSYEPSIMVSNSALSFAEAFTQTYYSYDYENKNKGDLSPYISKSLLSETAGGDFKNIDANWKVINTLAWKVDLISENQASVIVRATIQKTDQDLKKIDFIRYLQVPIAYNGVQFYVNDYPNVVPEPIQTGGEVTTYPTGTQVAQNIHNEIETTLIDFFTDYQDAKPSQLKYYMLDGKDLKGYEGILSFEKVKTLYVYDLSTDETQINVQAYVESEWKDTFDFIQKQHHTIKLIYKEDRWYISQFEGGYKS